MNDARGPRRGRHASPEDAHPRTSAPRPPSFPHPPLPRGAGARAREDRELPASEAAASPRPAEWAPAARTGRRLPGLPTPRAHSDRPREERAFLAPPGDERMELAARRPAGLLRADDAGEPVPSLGYRHRPGDGRAPADAVPRDRRGPGDDGRGPSRHPSAPLPPMPSGVWSRLQPSSRRPGDTAASGSDGRSPRADGRSSSAETEAHRLHDDDATGAFDVFGELHDETAEIAAHRYADFDERFDDVPGRDVPGGYDDERDHDEWDDDRAFPPHDEDPSDHPDEDSLPLGELAAEPFDPRRGRRRRRRRRVAGVVSLLVLAGLALGIVFGGRQMLALVHSPDYTGQGSGSVRIRVHDGDSLKAIGQTLVDDGVIASVRPFTTAAEADPRSTSIVPGLYGLRQHMSAKAALTQLLDPSSRLVSRVTIPEGLTAQQILQRLAQGTGVPLDQLKAAAANPASLQLPAYANGNVEGFLFPATYDFEPGTSPTAMLQAMVVRAQQTLDALQIPPDQRLSVLTEASIVQAEAGSVADMPKVARVLDNRLQKGMPLQLDTTVNYANGKSGLTTSAQDRANPSPYNTYLHAGLPPGPIGNPGEEALRAVMAPAQGDWLYFVVVNPETGETRFAATGEEHQKNVELFQQWLKAHPNG